MSGKLLTLKVSEIHENPEALRTTVDKDGVAYQELKDQVKAHGLLNPISVREVSQEDGSTAYTVVDGLQRLTVFADLGIDEIPVHVVNVADQASLIAMQIAGNHKVPTSKSEYAKSLKTLAQYKGFTVTELAAFVKKSVKWVQDQLNLADLPENLAKLLDSGRVPVPNMLALKKLPKDQVDDYLASAATEPASTFVPRVEQVVKEHKAAATSGRKPVTEFVPLPKPRKTTEIKSALDEYKSTGTISEIRSLVTSAGVSDPNAVAGIVLEWLLQLDAVSVAKAKAEFDAQQAQKEQAKKAREEEKARKAAEKVAATVAA